MSLFLTFDQSLSILTGIKDYFMLLYQLLHPGVYIETNRIKIP